MSSKFVCSCVCVRETYTLSHTCILYQTHTNLLSKLIWFPLKVVLRCWCFQRKLFLFVVLLLHWRNVCVCVRIVWQLVISVCNVCAGESQVNFVVILFDMEISLCVIVFMWFLYVDMYLHNGLNENIGRYEKFGIIRKKYIIW